MEGPARLRVLALPGAHPPALIVADLADGVVVFLRHENASILIGENAVSAVAAGLPDFRPLPARGDDAGDRSYGQVVRGLLRHRTATLLTLSRSFRHARASGLGGGLRRRHARPS